MDPRSDSRTVGRTVGLVGCTLALGAGVFLSDGPTVRPSDDIHAEYVKYRSGNDTITGYLAYPERKDPAPGVVVIHEIFGMSDFIRQTTEQLAKDGFVALAPDLLSRRGGTPSSTDDARKVIAGLNPDTVTLDLDASVAYLRTVKAARRDRIGVIGFCWGGGQSFRYATNNPALGAVVGCYRPGPQAAAVARVPARGVRGFAGNDARHDPGPGGRRGRGQAVWEGLSLRGLSGRGPRLPARAREA